MFIDPVDCWRELTDHLVALSFWPLFGSCRGGSFHATGDPDTRGAFEGFIGYDCMGFDWIIGSFGQGMLDGLSYIFFPLKIDFFFPLTANRFAYRASIYWSPSITVTYFESFGYRHGLAMDYNFQRGPCPWNKFFIGPWLIWFSGSAYTSIRTFMAWTTSPGRFLR